MYTAEIIVYNNNNDFKCFDFQLKKSHSVHKKNATVYLLQNSILKMALHFIISFICGHASI